MTEFWYDRPARQWVDGFPVGNGRLGAMVWGDRGELRLSVNEETFWSGPPRPETPDVPAGLMDAVRSDLRAGRHVSAGSGSRPPRRATPRPRSRSATWCCACTGAARTACTDGSWT
ncbi:glycoside hydrolase N-terminal domain-containing protein [Streptacidiphilus monticola]